MWNITLLVLIDVELEHSFKMNPARKQNATNILITNCTTVQWVKAGKKRLSWIIINDWQLAIILHKSVRNTVRVGSRFLKERNCEMVKYLTVWQTVFVVHARKNALLWKYNLSNSSSSSFSINRLLAWKPREYWLASACIRLTGSIQWYWLWSWWSGSINVIILLSQVPQLPWIKWIGEPD